MAQRRCAAAPRRSAAPPGAVLSPASQRRPGFAPRRHAIVEVDWSGDGLAQRRAGVRTRRHPLVHQHVGVYPVALNEGRGSHPGDTFAVESSRFPPFAAQRRPGFAPRRHRGRGARGGGASRRSTKAGVRTPATHDVGDGEERGDLPRSTKAGVRTPATPQSATSLSPRSKTLNEGRGSHPGDTPVGHESVTEVEDAQRRPGFAPRRHRPCSVNGRRYAPALNEGRGSHPGDTLCAVVDTLGTFFAQRRPGFAPRRHPESLHRISNSVAAQRRPGFAPRRHTATPSPSRRGTRSLNEGRGSHPGDTQWASTPSTRPRPLNEGRGSHPGDTGTAGRAQVDRVDRHRSTKAGVRTPATLPA